MSCRTPEAKVFRIESELNRLALARLQRHTTEALQLTHWPRRRPRSLVRIQLHHLIACDLACVLDVHRDLQRPTGLDRWLTSLQRADRKACVAQTIAKGIERRTRSI